MTVCTDCLSLKQLDLLIECCSELSDKRLWLLHLISSLNKSKFRPMILNILAIVAVAIASGVSDPTLSLAESKAFISIRQA